MQCQQRDAWFYTLVHDRCVGVKCALRVNTELQSTRVESALNAKIIWILHEDSVSMELMFSVVVSILI